MAAPVFKDISKTANDVLNDDYDYSRKLKIKTKTANGVTFTTEGAMAANKSILAKVGANFRVPQIGGLTISKLQVTTAGRIVAEADIANAIVDNLKVSFKFEDGSRKVSASQVGKLGLEYKQPAFTTNLEADITGKNVTGAGVAVVSGVIIGANAAFNVEKSAVSDFGGALAFGGADYQVTIASKKSLKTVAAAFHHKPCKSTIYAASIDYDVQTAANALTLGGRYVANAETTFAGKVNSDGFVSLACVQKVTPFLSLTTSAHIDAKHFEGDAHKFGLGLTIG
ncbi:voltage-dependent anion-selective channel protein [Thraustotheca clavata]|uniref:Voltage-dependent anion-selective channel protein n=1 Tax=Thraustotheca clavata TaxID=74557 RepID=A0A1W0A948_9STRA|nr:voltage-dependent anion-selective channel protein [Thraustotheca clavata]